MHLTAITYNLMRVVEEVSKAQNPDLIHPIKNTLKPSKKDSRLPAKKAAL